MVFASRGIGLSDPDLPALDVFNTLSGAELHRILRLERGLTYDVRIDHVPYVGVGQWRSYVVTSVEHEGEVREITARLIQSWSGEPRPPDATDRAVRQMAGRFRMSLENSEEVVTWIGEHLVTARNPSAGLSDYLDRIERVTPRDVQRVARRLLADGFRSVTLGGRTP